MGTFIRRIMQVAPPNVKVHIGIILVDTDVHVCLDRARKRAESSGRPVPEDFVKDVNKKAKDNAIVAKDFADIFVHIRNNADGVTFDGSTGGATEEKLRTFFTENTRDD